MEVSELDKIDLKKAREIQRIVARKAVLKDLFEKPVKYVGGVDVAFSEKTMFGSAVVLSYPQLRFVEAKVVSAEIKFPYIPTFLAFRELPAMIKAVKALKNKPNIFFVDANGILHPLKVGEATHLGVVLNIATIGVAKSLLCGAVRGEGGIREVIYKGEVLGYEVKTGKRAIYVSPGHKVSLKTALKLTLKVMRYRLPEPIRLAHIEANKFKQMLQKKRN